MTEGADRLSSEIGHILFMDIVAFSTMTMEEQARAAQELQAVVRATPEFQRAQVRKELICLPTGDGMALVFFGDPVAPAQCALEIARTLRPISSLKVRMGVHSGPISRASDITGKENVSGSGINMAQRVMNCGDAGHILVSAASAEVIREYEGWADRLRDLGEYKVKHDKPIRVFDLCSDEFGSPDAPSTLSEAVTDARPAGAATRKVALLYRRNVQPDDHMLGVLEDGLKSAGYEVFVDRHLTIGVQWALEIERKIREADAVIPLLSEASVQSEMLEYEVQTADQMARTQAGKPRILPVRIGFTGPLPDSLGRILNPIQYTLWRGAEDDQRVVDELISVLRNPPVPRTVISRERLEPVGGAVPLGSEFYIERPVDAEFKAAIARGDSIVLVKGARQMGKTSLLARGLQHARESGARVVLTDFQALNEEHLASADSLLLALASAVAVQLDLDAMPRDSWDSGLGPSMNMEAFIRRKVLAAFPERLVWGLDEVDRLFSCDFGSEVFGLFRSWHNRRSLDPTGPWSRLTLAIAYATEAHLFISDLNQSPFNIGTRVALDDFTPEQMAELNRRYGSPLRVPDELNRLHRLLAGQPYLVRRAFDEIVSRPMDLSALEAQAGEEGGPFGDHLRRILISLAKDPELTEVVRGVLRGESCGTSENFYRLRSAGVMAGESEADMRPRCELYSKYLKRHLLEGE